jgi:hypothetical protein
MRPTRHANNLNSVVGVPNSEKCPLIPKTKTGIAKSG